MGDPPDTNAAIWKSAEAVEAWTAEAERQERGRQAHRRLTALLLPFAEQDEFTFLDLGAGTGAASRTILDLRPRSTAVLADYSAEMMRSGERQMQRFAGRYRFAEIYAPLAPGGWYLNYDPVRPGDAVVETTWERVDDHDDPEAAVRRRNR